MKITLIGPVYPYKGGITHFTQQLNQEFSKKHEVQLISWKRRYPSFLVKNQVENNSSEVIKKNKSVFVLDYLNPLTWIKVVKLIKRNKSNLKTNIASLFLGLDKYFMRGTNEELKNQRKIRVASCLDASTLSA